MKPSRYFLVICLAAPFLSFLLLQKKQVNVWMIGDSTMCAYPPQQFPMHGWGMPFAHFFNDDVTIHNHAKGGRSTRTFLSENRWQPIVDSLQAGDYVFIQFGHNDEAKEPQYAERYTPVSDYKKNLLKFIDEARAKKAMPVLITPVSRLKFDKNGVQQETHTEYAQAVFDVAATTNAIVIDLDKMSRELYQKMGAENSKLLFMQLEAGEHPNYPDGKKDNTHFNEFGARKIAELVYREMARQNIDLSKYFRAKQ